MTQGLKAELMRAGVRPKKETYSEPDQGKDGKKVPTSRLITRLDIEEYDVPAPMADDIRVRIVKIPLKMHIGAPDIPVVRAGDVVRKGQLIAEPQGMGAKIHASIAGAVTDVARDYIEIRES
jgi:biotin carboxyl carrier protein